MILNTSKIPRPRKRHLKYVWKGLIVAAGISMIIGQIAFYLMATR